jgi:hypothetical protein
MMPVKCGLVTRENQARALRLKYRGGVVPQDEAVGFVAKQCPDCKKDYEVYVLVSDHKIWEGGAFVQNAFPYLTADEREILITGICGPCYDKICEPFEEE